jgi:large subunit ribosomal protein L9
MEVILKEEVSHLGGIGDVVKVKPGYARNFLIPRGLAVLADRRNLGQLEHERRVAADKRERALRQAQTLAEKLRSLRVALRARAGDEGKLFGSVTNIDIEQALAAQGITVDRRRIRLDEPIKTLGDHRVPVQLGHGIEGELVVTVDPEE